jgi:hypothetical protein
MNVIDFGFDMQAAIEQPRCRLPVGLEFLSQCGKLTGD